MSFVIASLNIISFASQISQLLSELQKSAAYVKSLKEREQEKIKAEERESSEREKRTQLEQEKEKEREKKTKELADQVQQLRDKLLHLEARDKEREKDKQRELEKILKESKASGREEKEEIARLRALCASLEEEKSHLQAEIGTSSLADMLRRMRKRLRVNRLSRF